MSSDIPPMFSSRQQVIDHLLAQKVRLGIRWSDVASEMGLSKEWTTAACLGQMQMGEEEAEKAIRIFQMPVEAKIWLQTVPHKASGIHIPPTDPLLYRFQEIIGVYGPALKELIHEEFGDGIMSAIDLRLNVERENPAQGETGDRVRIMLSGKFLPYKPF